jgi:hypothetical protein
MAALLAHALPVLLALLDPRVAAYVGAALAGHPEFGAQLEAIGQRESRLKRLGVHAGDAGASRAVWTDAVRAGLVDPRCQPYEPGEWSTRGSFGTMAGYTLHHLGRCLPPWVLDLPLPAAVASTRRAHDPRCDQVRGCRRWRDGS